LTIYNDRLRQVTGGGAPEEGDFNTARLTASDTSPSERRAILAELSSVECGGVTDQEAFEEGEYYEDEDLDPQNDGPEVDYLWASCRCGWQGSGMCWKGDNSDFEKAKEKIIKSHKSERPDCTLEPTIG
jgi:hypothetical protein